MAAAEAVTSETKDPDGRYIRLPTELEPSSGGTSHVWKAYDTDEGVEVAWHEVRLPASSEWLGTELRAIEGLAHDNIMSIFKSWVEGDTLIFVSELVTAGTLYKFVYRVDEVVRPTVVRKWCRQIMGALDFLHRRTPPFVHLALSLNSIFVNGATGDVRIGDFVSARVAGKVLETEGADALEQRTPESIAYCAPQVLFGDASERDPGVDVYALGMCVLEMVTRKPPYYEIRELARTEEEWRAMLLSVKRESRLPQVLETEVVEPELRAFIKACLERGEDGKYPTASALLRHRWLEDELGTTPASWAPAPAAVSAQLSSSATTPVQPAVVAAAAVVATPALVTAVVTTDPAEMVGTGETTHTCESVSADDVSNSTPGSDVDPKARSESALVSETGATSMALGATAGSSDVGATPTGEGQRDAPVVGAERPDGAPSLSAINAAIGGGGEGGTPVVSTPGPEVATPDPGVFPCDGSDVATLANGGGASVAAAAAAGDAVEIGTSPGLLLGVMVKSVSNSPPVVELDLVMTRVGGVLYRVQFSINTGKEDVPTVVASMVCDGVIASSDVTAMEEFLGKLLRALCVTLP